MNAPRTNHHWLSELNFAKIERRVMSVNMRWLKTRVHREERHNARLIINHELTHMEVS